MSGCQAQSNRTSLKATGDGAEKESDHDKHGAPLTFPCEHTQPANRMPPSSSRASHLFSVPSARHDESAASSPAQDCVCRREAGQPCHICHAHPYRCRRVSLTDRGWTRTSHKCVYTSAGRVPTERESSLGRCRVWGRNNETRGMWGAGQLEDRQALIAPAQ